MPTVNAASLREEFERAPRPSSPRCGRTARSPRRSMPYSAPCWTSVGGQTELQGLRQVVFASRPSVFSGFSAGLAPVQLSSLWKPAGLSGPSGAGTPASGPRLAW